MATRSGRNDPGNERANWTIRCRSVRQWRGVPKEDRRAPEASVWVPGGDRSPEEEEKGLEEGLEEAQEEVEDHPQEEG